MPLSARLPELSALEVLAAIADTGSLSAAAREVGLTQQAVSSRLKAVEAQTGVRLVNRTTRGSTLTPAGVVVAGWTEQLLDAARRLDAGLASMRTEARSHLKVMASLTIAEQLLPRWLVSMQVAARRRGDVAPEVTFTASGSEQVIEAVRDGQVELGFIETRSSTKGLRSKVVARDELVLVVPPEHKWAKRPRPLSADELDQSFLVSRRSGWRYLLGDLAPTADEGGTPDVLEFGSAASVRAAVLAGAGPAVMSRLAVRDDLTEGRLKAIPVENIDWRRDLRAIWVGERTPPAGAARELLTHIATGR